MILSHFLKKEEYLEDIFKTFKKIKSDKKYIRLALSWAVA